jgi:diadenosine tetraphosphate (Ap4A) HIT family hydrolase
MALHLSACDICTRIEDCRGGRQPGLIAELDASFVVLGDSQQFEGYTLLLAKSPATELFDLPSPERAAFFEEVAQVAKAVARVTGAHKINYECLGNMVPHVHMHIFPRRLSDALPLAPVWGQMHATGTPEADRCRLDLERHAPLIIRLRRELELIRLGDASTTVNVSQHVGVLA